MRLESCEDDEWWDGASIGEFSDLFDEDFDDLIDDSLDDRWADRLVAGVHLLAGRLAGDLSMHLSFELFKQLTERSVWSRWVGSAWMALDLFAHSLKLDWFEAEQFAKQFAVACRARTHEHLSLNLIRLVRSIVVSFVQFEEQTASAGLPGEWAATLQFDGNPIDPFTGIDSHIILSLFTADADWRSGTAFDLWASNLRDLFGRTADDRSSRWSEAIDLSLDLLESGS